MPNPEEHVERIVHEVLSRLAGGAAPVDKSSSGSPDSTPPASISPGELSLDDKIVSAATLTNRLVGVQRVVVTARAIVTPSARDLLRDKNITLVRALKSAAPASAQLIVGISGVRFDLGSIAAPLRQRDIELQQSPGSSLQEIVVSIVNEIKSHGKRGILLTDKVAGAVCLANRTPGVRAVAVANRAELVESLRSIGANLLVVDALRRGKFEIQRIVESFATAPAKDCPSEWKAILE